MAIDLVPFEKYLTAIRSKATANQYSTATLAFLNWVERAFGPIPIKSLPKDVLSQYAMAMLDGGYLPGTIQTQLAGINRYFRWLHEKYDVELPKFHPVELPKVKRKVKDVLSYEMLGHFFRAAGELSEPLRTAVMLLPCSGLRSNEMASLPLTAAKRSEFKLGDGAIKDTLCLTVTGKGGHERIVPLLDEGAEILLEYTRGWRAKYLDQRFMFPGQYDGKSLSTRAIGKAVQKIRGALQMQFTPHTMRRTYLTSLYRKGVDVTMLAKIAGHGDVQVLINHYLALDEQDVVRAVHATGGNLTP